MDTADQETEPRRRGGPFRFFGEVRAEARKVTWATRQEVTVSSIMVFIMAVVAAVFFFLVDSIAGGLIRWILGIG
ncbi:MAG: preprotein translocase subunit SecE [Hyphomonadaceae bacterium]|nr:preprotein translocase subunit SecE [Hyphomonadaceae bacterium]MBX3511213.1 preprotein translocase subunit SecE [Hyphomonadaceae bacterium]